MKNTRFHRIVCSLSGFIAALALRLRRSRRAVN
jgi:hypothetical protein